MRQILPVPPTGANSASGDDVDPLTAYDDVEGDALRVGMVVSADGSATDQEHWTDGLGGEADLRVFRALRAWADAILIGANTIRSGHVGPHRPRPEARAIRQKQGRPTGAPIVVVSQSLRGLDWTTHRLFTEAEHPTIIVTCAQALSTVEPPATVPVVIAGDDRIDLTAAIATLQRDHGFARLLCEGGPQLATGLLAAGLVDELCLSIAPTLIGRPHHTRLLGHLPGPTNLRLHRVYEDEGVLFVRYQLQ